MPRDFRGATSNSVEIFARLSALLNFAGPDGRQMTDLLLRFMIGGIVVSVFSLIGDLFKPKSFAGLFGAAPSVALATLALTVSRNGQSFATLEARSMIAGAAGLLVYAQTVAWLLARRRIPALNATLFAMPVWFGVTFGCWWVFLR